MASLYLVSLSLFFGCKHDFELDSSPEIEFNTSAEFGEVSILQFDFSQVLFKNELGEVVESKVSFVLKNDTNEDLNSLTYLLLFTRSNVQNLETIELFFPQAISNIGISESSDTITIADQISQPLSSETLCAKLIHYKDNSSFSNIYDGDYTGLSADQEIISFGNTSGFITADGEVGIFLSAGLDIKAVNGNLNDDGFFIGNAFDSNGEMILSITTSTSEPIVLSEDSTMVTFSFDLDQTDMGDLQSISFTLIKVLVN